MQMLQVLIVDNDRMAALVTQHSLQRMLEQAAAVETAASPVAARARCLHGHVDLLIIDPGAESSVEMALLQELQRVHSKVVVLVLTAYDTPRLRSQMRSLGIAHYLAKPIELRDLGEAVQRLVTERNRHA